MIISVDEEIQYLVLYRTSAAINSEILALPRLLELVLELVQLPASLKYEHPAVHGLNWQKKLLTLPIFFPRPCKPILYHTSTYCSHMWVRVKCESTYLHVCACQRTAGGQNCAG